MSSTEHAQKHIRHRSIRGIRMGLFSQKLCLREKNCYKDKFWKYKTLHLYVISQIFPTLYGFRVRAHLKSVSSFSSKYADVSSLIIQKDKFKDLVISLNFITSCHFCLCNEICVYFYEDLSPFVENIITYGNILKIHWKCVESENS